MSSHHTPNPCPNLNPVFHIFVFLFPSSFSFHLIIHMYNCILKYVEPYLHIIPLTPNKAKKIKTTLMVGFTLNQTSPTILYIHHVIFQETIHPTFSIKKKKNPQGICPRSLHQGFKLRIKFLFSFHINPCLLLECYSCTLAKYTFLERHYGITLS
ncbi:hypothetical protein HanIR_Chr07g0310321 [Helianthus annuus]|nr:hypothetical protein HanIR_Chr07g0310321 [Helianthus annuus]